jgi:hypothetical protein
MHIHRISKCIFFKQSLFFFFSKENWASPAFATNGTVEVSIENRPGEDDQTQLLEESRFLSYLCNVRTNLKEFSCQQKIT